MSKVHFSEQDRILDPCKDIVFKLLFTRETPSSRAAISSLVSAYLGRKAQVIIITANEPPAFSPNDRQIRYDITCRLDGGELADLEMTLYPKKSEAARLEYHIARLFINQNIKGVKKSFGDLKPAYQISLFYRENLFPDDKLVHHFGYYDHENGVSLGGQTGIVTVELKKAARLLEKPVNEMSVPERWAIFFRYGAEREQRSLINELLAEEEGIAMAGEELLTVTEDERYEAWLRSAETFDMDYQDDMEEARRAGQAEGRVESQERIRQVEEQNRQLEAEIRRLRGE
jgi:predicted transposase/invertase (TIGR01784 family)